MKQLYDLQELDWSVSAETDALAEVRAKLADDSAAVEAKARLRRIESEIESRTAARREVESIAQRLEEKIEAVERKLYGGSITNPRELSAYEDERKLHRDHLNAEENKLLELMVEMDDLEAVRDRAHERSVEIEAKRRSEIVDLERDQERLLSSLEELRRRREDAAALVDPPALETYESLRRSLNGYVVAKVERSLCQGCRLALSTMELQRAKSSQSIVQCGSCRRILYVR